MDCNCLLIEITSVNVFYNFFYYRMFSFALIRKYNLRNWSYIREFDRAQNTKNSADEKQKDDSSSNEGKMLENKYITTNEDL